MRPRFLPVIAVLLLAATSAATTVSDQASFQLVRTGTGLSLHDEMFILPYSWSELYDGSESEVVFQLSAKHDILSTRFYVAYTQISFWQAYNTAESAPFRDTNYNPEIFYRVKERPLGSGFLGADVGGEHESNGQRVPLSRSWNLLYLTPWYRTDQWLVHAKARYRLPEDDKESPGDVEGDDNPDITDYLGHSDITVARLFDNGHQLRFLMRGYLGTDKGLLQLTWSFIAPGSDGDTYWCVRFSNGWGESMMDYNRHNTRIGVGFMHNR